MVVVHCILPFLFNYRWVLLFQLNTNNGQHRLSNCSHMNTVQSTDDILARMFLLSFLSILLVSPNRNWQSFSLKYRLNRYWHHTIHLKKKTFPIIKNPLKTLWTSTKVLSSSKIPLTDFASYENIVPLFQISSFPPAGLIPKLSWIWPLRQPV